MKTTTNPKDRVVKIAYEPAEQRVELVIAKEYSRKQNDFKPLAKFFFEDKDELNQFIKDLREAHKQAFRKKK